MFRKQRKGLTAAVLAALLALPLGAAEAAGGTAGRAPAGLWSQLAEWLRAQAESVAVFWAADQTDEGPYVDPFGKTTGSDQTDEGSSIDPDGR